MEQRLAWIRSQYQPDRNSHAPFALQPYEQLAGVYRNAGHDTRARKVAVAGQADMRKYGNLNRYRKFGNWLLDKIIGYGYHTWRAGVLLAVLYGAAWVLADFAQHHHGIIPMGSVKDLHPVPSAMSCTDSYPCFYPAGYAFDIVVPIINVHQAQYWGPDGHGPLGRVWVTATWMVTVLGWVLATFLVTGYTGLARRNG